MHTPPYLRTWMSVIMLAMVLTLSLLLGSASAVCGPGQQSDYCSPNYGLRGEPGSLGGRMAMAGATYPAIAGARLPVAGQLTYEDYKAVEFRARELLRRNMNFRLDISPYRGDNEFDELVRKFDAAGGFNATAPDNPNLTMQGRIDLADAELREARDLYASLVVFASETRFRNDDFYKNGGVESLCGSPVSKEDPNPPDPNHSGQVLDPIIDWCDFPARLRQSVREAAEIRMIFGQQFMVDALGLQFGSELMNGEERVRWEMARLRAAKHQFELAEAGMAEAMTRVVGNGCVVSDFYMQPEWSLLSRAAEGQGTIQHHIAIRQSYLNINNPNDVPQAKATAETTFRAAAIEGYVKMARMAGMTTNPTAGFGCALGVAPDAQLASDMANGILETRRKAREMSDGRNVFGFDVNFTPARPYYLPPGSQDRGLWNEAMAAADFARDLEKEELENSRFFDQTQLDLRNAITQLKETLDMEISNDLSCSRAGSGVNDAEFFACAREQMQELLACLDYVRYEKVLPTSPIPGVEDFNQCMNRRDGRGELIILEGSGARQALFDLRSAFLEQYSIEQRARNIDQRIRLSNGRNATVTKWLGIAGGAETAARVSAAMLDMISASGDNPFNFKKAVEASVVGTINIGLQAVAGALSTAADVEIANAEQYEEVQNLLLDQSELLIDAIVAEQAFRAKYVEFMGILGHMEDVIAEAQRQRAYLQISPGNDPSYRMIRDAKRLDLAKRLDSAARLSYLAARRAEYEYAARLSSSNFRISDIYRARTASDITGFLISLKDVTDNLAASVSGSDINPSDFTISVAQHVLGLTDSVLAGEGFNTPEAAEAERVRRFRLWVAENTVANDFEPPFDGKDVLQFSFTTSLLNGGVFSSVIQQGYDRYWLLKLAGIGEPKLSSTGMSIDLLTTQTGLSYRTLSVAQSGITHLRAFNGCVYDYRLMPPAVLLGLEWPSNQPPEQATAVFKGNINSGHDWSENGFRTPAFLRRPVSATDWQVMIFSGAPENGMSDMDLLQMTDIELNFSTTYASRTPGSPQPSECTRIDY